jgi:16S rRNA processing protein RimM
VRSGDIGIDHRNVNRINPISPDIVSVAKIVKEWGVRGEVKALALSKHIFSLDQGAEVSLTDPTGGRSTAKIVSLRRQASHVIVALEGCLDAASASRLRGFSIGVSRDSIPLEENEYFCDQLIGLTVVTTSGERIGRVDEIFETGSNDVYVVKRDDKTYLLPAIKDVIQEIDLRRQRITIKAMTGLLD